MRLTIELETRADGWVWASIPALAGVVAEGESGDQACSRVIALALQTLEEPNGVTFVNEDREWTVTTDSVPPSKRAFARPTSIEEVVEAVQRWPQLHIAGRKTGLAWHAAMAFREGELLPSLPQLELQRLSGIVQHDVADQVVVVRAGTPLRELNDALAQTGQCIPIAHPEVMPLQGSVGGAIAYNFPHLLEGQTGTWRDWIVGLTAVLADGTVVKGGSKAVKNVAGYDVQKLFIGARGTLGVVVEVILRTYPLRALPAPKIVAKGDLARYPLLIHRVLRSDFEAAFAQYDRAIGEPATGTIWANLDVPQDPIRFEGDWLIRSLAGVKNLPISDPTMIRLMKRTKDLFDPTHKLNPGEMGIF